LSLGSKMEVFIDGKDYIVSVFVKCESLVMAKERIDLHLKEITLSFEYVDLPYFVECLKIFDMDFFVIKQRGGLLALEAGRVVMGWAP
jgi:hypothetical protein